MQQSAGRLEARLTLAYLAAVHDGRVGERSPHGGDGFVAECVIDDFVPIEQAQAMSSGHTVVLRAEDPRIVRDVRFGCGYGFGSVDRGDPASRKHLLIVGGEAGSRRRFPTRDGETADRRGGEQRD
jgi:hypothetical protein